MNSVLSCRLTACFLAVVIALCHGAVRADEPSSDYKVSPLDILAITVVGEKDLLQDCRVTSSGTITYQWLSNVEVAGKTAAEIEQLIRKKLDEDYLVNPTVLVQIKSYREREATVIGHVFKPGAFILPAEQKLTIMDLLARAGGATPRGNDNNIVFTRRGEREPMKLKKDDLLKITDPDKMIYVQPGDVIEIKERAF